MTTQPRSSLLGNTTKFSSASDFLSQYGDTALRFYLLEVARGLLPDNRIQVCWRYPLPARKSIEIIYSDERGCARSNGTMKCGSGWVCPACMRYIAQRRREELELAMARSKEKYFTVMLTFTARHNRGDKLAELLASMVKAYGKVFSGRWWHTMKSELMANGAIRATEITYGANGWHPHFHVIWFVDKAMLDDDIAGSPEEYAQAVRNHVGDQWLTKLESVGLSGNSAAFDVRTANDDIAEYVSKWGHMPANWSSNVSAYEVASAVTKKAKAGNIGVLDMLFEAGQDENMKRLYLEYYHATKGKSQLHWSKGLKAELDIDIIRDEIAAQGIETETDRLLAEIHISDWRNIVNNGFLGQVMTHANTGDENRLKRLLARLKDRFPVEIVDLGGFDIKGMQ